jgi:hypothetical protein
MLSKKSQTTEAANFPLKDKTSGGRHSMGSQARWYRTPFSTASVKSVDFAMSAACLLSLR